MKKINEYVYMNMNMAYLYKFWRMSYSENFKLKNKIYIIQYFIYSKFNFKNIVYELFLHFR